MPVDEQEYHRKVRDMESVLDSLKRDPVKYGVPRNLFEWSLTTIKELWEAQKALKSQAEKADRLEHENRLLRAGPRDAIDM